MKKLFLFTCIFCFFIMFNGATFAYVQNCTYGTCLDYDWNSSAGKFVGCSTCTCDTNTLTCIECDASHACGTGYTCTAYECVQNCTTCSNCNDVGWTSSGIGYEVYTEKYCDCGICESTLSYRCSTGYYGTANATGTNGCTSCASGTGVSGSTSVAGNNSLITNCYLPTNYSSSNAYGSYIYTQACYYSN